MARYRTKAGLAWGLLTLIVLAATCFAQEEPADQPAKPAGQVEDVVKSLLGDTQKTKKDTEAAPTASEGAESPTPGGEVEPDTEEPSATEDEAAPPDREEPSRGTRGRRDSERARDRETSRETHSDTAVPVVPPSVDDEMPVMNDDLAAPAEATPDQPPAPVDDYRQPAPEPATGLGATDTTSTEQPAAAAPAETAPVTEPKRNPNTATTILVALIVLAVLLVLLAAVVGVMAAQRANRTIAAAPPAAAEAWAYLSAPGVPDIPINAETFVVGSDEDCDLRLADPKASPNHARIDETEDGWVITDLNSTNGTYLNGERIASPVSLRSGDEVQMGDIVVTFNLYE